MVITLISQMDRDLIRASYGIRRAVFIDEHRFPEDDNHGMIMNKYDALSVFHLAVEKRIPVGTVAIADWTGLDKELADYQVSFDGKIAKITKLAILPSARDSLVLLNIIRSVKKSLVNLGFEYAILELFPPSNRIEDLTWTSLADQYRRFGFDNQRNLYINGLPTVILEGSLKDKL
jgi:hypothetical protein